jgi:hypothetical protein
MPATSEPDRGYWRLLEDVFSTQPDLFHDAVRLTATGHKYKRGEGKPADEKALGTLEQVPVASYGDLCTHDRREIENYRALHLLIRDYLVAPSVQRPLSIAVFGAPGAGKSFGIEQVAGSLKTESGCREVKKLTFNLALLRSP